MKSSKSLRNRLLFSLMGAVFLLWLVFGVVTYQVARVEAGEMLDGQLAQTAHLIIAQMQQVQMEPGSQQQLVRLINRNDVHPYEQSLEFQVWDAYGKLWVHSDNAPIVPIARHDGYADIHHAGQPWRMLAMWSPEHRFQVQVAEPVKDREVLAFGVATHSVLPMFLALPFMAGLIYLAVKQSMRPLDDVALSVAARSKNNLDPIATGVVPREARPLIDALNGLLERLASALEFERRFTSDAAHELRTPLAAIKVQAQVCQMSTDEAMRSHALTQVTCSVDRASRLVEQLLRLARLDPLSGIVDAVSFDLGPLVQDVINELHPAAQEKNQSLEFTPPPSPVQLHGDPEMLRVAIRNLLENAIRYTPVGGHVSAGIQRSDLSVRFWVRDTGQGALAEDLPHLTERFYRGGNVAAGGSGLGLPIVKRVAELNDARLHLSNMPGGGLEAVLEWA
ncbi:MAG: ATP-binding protein [Thiobacillus sp.]|jgi:two-component system sensor histidine kinase QseC